ncbi:hypothetical protein QBC34DRAFT_289498 [Podospora aff. communis PSN243]|uniref:J domain-containing protein n=1 Tax=Podospora aff. communis PSN243 TaxID=3040156 RepID=A0AAV9H311_9PEZI|nr:hypothetical protein QBC34DRAFT_289498 [Podospora aff. communis PSN243]
MADARSRRVASGAYDESSSGSLRGGYAASHRLRPAASRFSLRDQFATTRREIEFGFDDSSTVASEAIWGDNDDPVIVSQDAASAAIYRNYYELLCLPRDPALPAEQVQKQFQRVVHVLAVDNQPARFQSTASYNLGLAQAAFETLIDPCRRAGYDLSVESECDSDEAEFAAEGQLSNPEAFDKALQEQFLLLTQGGIRSTTDLGLRLEAGPPSLRRPRHRLSMLDFALKHKHLRFSEPTVTVTGAAHGLLDEPYRLAPILLGRYQPPGPSVHGRRRLEQLLVSRFLPVLNLTVRQEVFWRDPYEQADLKGSSHRHPPDSVVEHEVELLPHPSTTFRFGHSIDVQGEDPLNVEVSLHKGVSHRTPLPPSLGIALSQKRGQGTAFVVVDAGDWQLFPSNECRNLSRFSKITGGLPQLADPFRHAPTFEAGYSFGTESMGVLSERPFTKSAERGVLGVDHDMDGVTKTGPWTISAGVASGIAASYLRYALDLFPGRKKIGIRAEVELASSTQRDFFLAFRALKRIGRFSKAGLEVGLSPNNIHLSLYWSRLGQRISLPFMVSRRSSLGTKFLFWATVVPYAAFAAVELAYWRMKLANAKSDNTAKDAAPSSKLKEDLQRYIARKRAEADELTVVLATGVEPRQNKERQNGGLVILSAKYGAKDAPPDEIADVTIAVAALVDGGKLVIPAGTRKSRLLGFWDPGPMSTKVLRVRYAYQGSEKVVEVSGRAELKLP